MLLRRLMLASALLREAPRAPLASRGAPTQAPAPPAREAARGERSRRPEGAGRRPPGAAARRRERRPSPPLALAAARGAEAQ